ncbi:MAG: hypothetical protein EDX89_07255 [Acidobacteria bacterium]|nr:MAG: hypothetical protein EDX89_07255 [Acidobacteriota bacterium]MCE7959094.1 hypothetical protein [Acidobacteria bacterium ACB2]
MSRFSSLSSTTRTVPEASGEGGAAPAGSGTSARRMTPVLRSGAASFGAGAGTSLPTRSTSSRSLRAASWIRFRSATYSSFPSEESSSSRSSE